MVFTQKLIACISSTLLCVFLPACSLLFGTIKPVSEKSADYKVSDLLKFKHDWEEIDKETLNEGMGGAGAEYAYRSKKTGATVSLDSSCQNFSDRRITYPLTQLTLELFRGIENLEILKQDKVLLSRLNALYTLAKAQENGKTIYLRTVVAVSERCVFDLMYISRLQNSPVEEMDFEQFWKSFNIK